MRFNKFKIMIFNGFKIMIFYKFKFMVNYEFVIIRYIRPNLNLKMINLNYLNNQFIRYLMTIGYLIMQIN